MGSGRAMAQLGRMYLDGRGGLAKNPEDAVRLFQAGARLLDAMAMFELGRTYEIGTAGANDRREAVRWYRDAASFGFVDALERLQALGEDL